MYKSLILDFTEWFLIFAGFSNLILGWILLLKPGVIQKLDEKSNVWISTRRVTKSLSTQHDTSELLFKYNTLLGWILLVGFVACLYIFFHNIHFNDLEGIVDQLKYGVVVSIVLSTFKWIFLLYIIIGIILMLLLIFAPDILKKIYSITDRWVSTRSIFYSFDKFYFRFDEYILNHNIIFGIFMILCSVVMFFLYR